MKLKRLLSNLLMLILTIGILWSCAGKHKITSRDKEKTNTEQSSSTDSTSSKSSVQNENGASIKDETYEIKDLSEDEGFEVTLVPTGETKDSTATVKIKTPKGTYELQSPVGYNMSFKTQKNKTNKTETTSIKSETKNESSKTEKEKSDVSRETSKTDSKVVNTRSSDSTREEPIWFNLGFWALVLIILVAGYIYYRFNTLKK